MSKKNEVTTASAASQFSYDLVPSAQTATATSEHILRTAHKGTQPGFHYGSTYLGTKVDMVFIGRRMWRQHFGVDYSLAQKTGVKFQPRVCMSADGVVANGIARNLNDEETAALANGAQDPFNWAKEVTEQRCQDGSGEAICPLAKDWVCRPRFNVFVLVRVSGDPEAGWMPAIYLCSGQAVREMNSWRGKVEKARMMKQTKGKISDPWRFWAPVELIDGKMASLKPQFGEVLPFTAEESKLVADTFIESSMMMGIFTSDTNHAQGRQDMIGQPPLSNDDEPDDSNLKAEPMV